MSAAHASADLAAAQQDMSSHAMSGLGLQSSNGSGVVSGVVGSSGAAASGAASPAPAGPAALELRCLLDNAAVGGIIGKGGACVREVREQTGITLSIVKQEYRQAQERIMILKGHAAQVAHAAKLIAQLLIEATSRREEHPVDTASLRLLVHKTGIGAIIGKGGATIKEIQMETGARVQVSNDTLPQSSEKTVTVTGNAAQMYAAMLRISQQLIANPLKPGTKVYAYVPGNSQLYQSQPPAFGAPQQPQQGSVPFQQQPNQAPIHHLYAANGLQQPQQNYGGVIRGPAPAVLSTQKIAIPTICCGSIIGKGGAVIRDLRSQSGTGISISDPEISTPDERVVTLTGSPQGISHAVFLIRQLVEAYQPAGIHQAQSQPQQQQQSPPQQPQQIPQQHQQHPHASMQQPQQPLY